MGPSSSLASGKMVSWWMMMVLMISLTWAWQDTWSWLSGVGMSVGPKHMARLYGSIMFSSLYWDRLEERGRERCGERDQGRAEWEEDIALGTVFWTSFILRNWFVSVNLLVEEGEEVAHDDEDWSRNGQEDLTNVQRSLIQVLYS